MSEFTFTSESVTEGHPDKMADQISDSVLDALLEQDPMSRVACETMVTTGLAVIAGEITTQAYVDIPGIVRKTICDIGYDNGDFGYDGHTCGVMVAVDGEQTKAVPLGDVVGKINYVPTDHPWVIAARDLATSFGD